MSTLRYDPAQRPGPMGMGRSMRLPWGGESLPGGMGPGMGLGAWEDARPFLSVVVPARDEAANLPQLTDEITRALRRVCGDDEGGDVAGGPRRLAGFEIVVVDDGSIDSTRSVLKDLAADYPEVRGLILAAGVGQSAATVAGIRAARGDWIATLDADLQNDPADLVRLWHALPGHDVALGWRAERQDVWSKRVISHWANRVRNSVLGQSIRDTGCSVRIFPREVALRLPTFRGVHRFFGPLLLREGCRLVQVPVRHRPRPHGRSHYSLWNRSLRVVIDLFGVAWLLRRPVRYRVVRSWDSWSATGGEEQRPEATVLAGVTDSPAPPYPED